MTQTFAAIETTAEIELESLVLAMRRMAEVTGKGFGQIVLQNSRLAAKNLAISTHPWNGADGNFRVNRRGDVTYNGREDLDIMKKAIARDIGKVYTSAQLIFKQLQDEGEKIAAAWYRAMKNGNFSLAEDLIRGTKNLHRNAYHGIPLDPAFHQRSRNSRGRVSRHRAAQILPDAKDIKARIKEKQALAGFGKAGWITAGSALGKISNVPAWITRHRGIAPGQAQNATQRPTDPYVTLTNDVRYASSICTDQQVAFAINLQRQKMLAHIEHVLVNSAREAGFTASADAPSEPLPMAA